MDCSTAKTFNIQVVSHHMTKSKHHAKDHPLVTRFLAGMDKIIASYRCSCPMRFWTQCGGQVMPRTEYKICGFF